MITGTVEITYLPFVPHTTARAEAPRKKKERTKEPIERKALNEKFANDGSLGSVQLLLYKIATKSHARVEAMGLPMSFDDVLQEMYVGYIKSKEKWNPNGEALFNTYCTIVCVNNFNHIIKKMERERGVILIGSEGEFVSNTGEGSETSFMESQAAPESDDPAYRVEASQEMARRLASLSLSAKKLISVLLAAEKNPQVESVSLREAAKQVNVTGPELRRLKLEILETYGVTWH